MTVDKSRCTQVASDRTGTWIAVGAFFAPFVAFISSFAVLCLVECTALPWFTFYLAPIVTVGLWILLLVLHLRWRRLRAARSGA
jgi:hypothetical protein